ncbi:unnamed protein product, partial [Rotaria socialis]
GSFVPKKFAGSSGGGSMSSSSSWSKSSSKTTSKNMNQSSKPSSSELNTKEKSMLVMLGIEDDPLVCLRTQESKGLADSMADVRELYEAKQAAGKVKRIRYDER